MNMALSLISVLTVLAATFVRVHAQEISQCVLNCVSQAASANGCDLTNTQCLCTNRKVQPEAINCLLQSCSAQDLQNAESLLESECAFYSTVTLSLTTSTLSSSSLAVGRFTTTIIAAVPLADPTFSALPTPTPTPPASKSSLTTGAVVGIAVASSATTICLAIAASFWYMRRRKQRKPVPQDHSAANNVNKDEPASRHPESASVVGSSWKPNSRRYSYSDTGHAYGGVTTGTTRTDLEEIHLYDNDNDSVVPDPLVITPYPQSESGHPLIAPEKSLGRPGDGRVVPTSPVHRLGDSPVEASVPSGYGVEQRRLRRHETDGGVRVAGGRAGEVVAVEDDRYTVISEGSTLPPPYSSHFGET